MTGFFESFIPIAKALPKYRLELLLVAMAIITGLISLIIYFSLTLFVPEENVISISRPPIMVEIAGAINKPAVYEVTSSARLKDLIELAGGLSDQADIDYFHRNFNLAKIVVDQEKIYIPSTADNQTDADMQNQLTLININKADLELLDTLPGVGFTTAQKIIQNRPYSSIEELLNKKIMKKNVYEQIKEMISL